jgi:regulator of replication initiation timing
MEKKHEKTNQNLSKLMTRVNELQTENFALKNENDQLRKRIDENNSEKLSVIMDVYDQKDVSDAFLAIEGIITDPGLAAMYDVTPTHIRGINIVNRINRALA